MDVGFFEDFFDICDYNSFMEMELIVKIDLRYIQENKFLLFVLFIK